MKKSLKITIIVSVAVILIVALSVALFLRGSIRSPALLTAKVQKELSIWPRFADSKVWWSEDDPVGHIRYYGTYSGWHIICENSLAETEDMEIGEFIFNLPQSGIYAVKGTKTADPGTLYEEGVLDDKDIAKIYEYHTYAEKMEDDFLAEHPD